MSELSVAQRRVLEFAAQGHTLIRSYGLHSRARWGGLRDGPKCRIDTAYILIRRGFLEVRPDIKNQRWKNYYRVSEAGRAALDSQ